MSKIFQKNEGVGNILTKFVACQNICIHRKEITNKLHKSLGNLIETYIQASHILVALGSNPYGISPWMLLKPTS